MVLTPDTWTASFYLVDDMLQPDSPVTEVATWVTEAGSPGVQEG